MSVVKNCVSEAKRLRGLTSPTKQEAGTPRLRFSMS